MLQLEANLDPQNRRRCSVSAAPAATAFSQLNLGQYWIGCQAGGRRGEATRTMRGGSEGG